MTDRTLTTDHSAPDLQQEHEQEPRLSGADLARIVLQSARRTARANGNATVKGRQPTLGEIARQGRAAREATSLGAIIPAMASAHGWDLGTARGTLRDRWAAIVGTENALHWAPAGFNADTRTLRVVADSPAWATKLRLTTRKVLADLDKHLPPGSVRAIDIRVGHHQAGPDDDRPRTPAQTAPTDDRPRPLADNTAYRQLRQQMRDQLLAREAAREEEHAQMMSHRRFDGWQKEPEHVHGPGNDARAAEEAAAHEDQARRSRESHRAALAAARAAKAGAVPPYPARRPAPRAGTA
ncbi:DciA family protein [Streptomyces sp. BE20]|uniref:DciA family protein n=1 Tax=Streptomyces sp. BE20 TaxID=3002525 RepID=UPI002E776140|nr:DciA family protein [Streptomyces sp. BE20]MEE1821243.1 DciA family protein [Streptomyces sp. BE20]